MARSHAFVVPSRSRAKGLVLERPAFAKPAPSVAATPIRPSEKGLRSLTLAGAMSAPRTELLRMAVRRSRLALACPCGGRAVRTKCTIAERARFGGESFARAFVCGACHVRYVGRARPLPHWTA